MSMERCIYRIARIVLESRTPLSIGTGRADGGYDSELLRDANGLPAIPGSSLAGVLRALWVREHGSEQANALFGYQQGNQGGASALEVSWGCLHNAKDKAVQGRVKWEDLKKDALLGKVLQQAVAPVARDRVRIHHRGAADTEGRGKFDRSVLPAGHRFTVELSLWDNDREDHKGNWEEVLKLFSHPLFRLGGGTRAGLGVMDVLRLHEGSFDLREHKGREHFTTLSRDLNDVNALSDKDVKSRYEVSNWQDLTTMDIALEPEDYWRIGQGDPEDLKEDAANQRPTSDKDKKPPDMLPRLEARVKWMNGKGEYGDQQLLVPASSIKGVLAHRTAFHANRLGGKWAGKGHLTADRLKTYDKSTDEPHVQALFGHAKEDSEKEGKRSGNKGQAGCVLIDDVYVTFKESDLDNMMHNVIDRFTGGVREHLLFEEQVVRGKDIQLRIVIDTKRLAAEKKVIALQAFKLALRDLTSGRLAVGAASGRGHGFFTGKYTWKGEASHMDAQQSISA